MKKQKGAGGRGESPVHVCDSWKKSRVEYYIFFSPFPLQSYMINIWYSQVNIYIINHTEMIYRTKADLLGRLGKARSDVRLIDRMVGRGEVKKTSEWYELNENFFIKWINEYDKNMIKEYDKSMIQENVYDKNMSKQVQNSNEILDINTAYYEKKIKLYKDSYEKLIGILYNDLKAEPDYIEMFNERIRSMWVWVDRESDK